MAGMDKEGLTRIGAGFYADGDRKIYFRVREFLAAHRMPDTPEARAEVWAEVRRDFGVIGVTELEDG
ncbi:MAG TPA: hypothetical protein VGJ51_13300 [Candidatus Angelobacter sp.]|jgi:hypothetical protein